ncbi:hypothetical protein [Rhodoplanes sp. Z2-YC6860]|uniref:hypothetical protein n=1 Tax=Rhodoplanes sp. Z2-YC6860 TaxID=674703 RepID=UPI0012ED5F64|nr:hypothetical protein [Rhodoplanes sp. Z2-YC6860]
MMTLCASFEQAMGLLYEADAFAARNGLVPMNYSQIIHDLERLRIFAKRLAEA